MQIIKNKVSLSFSASGKSLYKVLRQRLMATVSVSAGILSAGLAVGVTMLAGIIISIFLFMMNRTCSITYNVVHNNLHHVYKNTEECWFMLSADISARVSQESGATCE